MAFCWTDIRLLDWLLPVLIAVIFVFRMYCYVRYIAAVQRRFRHKKYKRFRWKNIPDDADGAPKGVSVIICAKNEEHNLCDYLPMVLSQDYPLFEVIVVNDASLDNTELVLEHYRRLYPNLHLTFVPQNSRLCATKKLGITLAAKAAQYDYLLLTDADCVPESKRWISEMMSGFRNPDTDIVIGYGAYFMEKTAVNRFIQYETLTTGLLYLGLAMEGHPYMGVGRNLAYRKELFFRSGGFSNMLQQKAGDDDLFVNRVATRRNTEVVVTRDSITWSVPKHTFEEWFVQKKRHLSVAPAYRTGTKWRLASEPVARALWYIGMIVAAVAAAQGALNIFAALAIAALFVIMIVTQAAILTRSSHLLGTRGFGLSVLFFDIFMPLMQLTMLMRRNTTPASDLKWN